jgi:hypothetical protein
MRYEVVVLDQLTANTIGEMRDLIQHTYNCASIEGGRIVAAHTLSYRNGDETNECLFLVAELPPHNTGQYVSRRMSSAGGRARERPQTS